MPINDNDAASAGAPSAADAHGQAALMLIESLIHGLCANAVLTIGQAVEITERAIDAQYHRSEEAEGADAAAWQPHALLMSIAASLRTDAQGEPPRAVDRRFARIVMLSADLT